VPSGGMAIRQAAVQAEETETPLKPGRHTSTAAGMVLCSIVSIQCGSALATSLFDDVGTAAAVFLRSFFGALILILATRPRSLAGFSRPLVREIVLFGVVLSAMNLAFFAAIDRLPLGTAVTLEFLGPLGVALAGTRRPRDLLWVVLAAGGVFLLSGGIGGDSEVLGVAFALLAAACWAAYIVLNARIGGRHAGLVPLALAMALSAVLTLPFGIHAGGNLLSAGTLATGLAIGLLSSALPYALELEALRTLPNSVFGVLLSLEPAVAAVIGFVALSQGLSAAEIVAVAMVVIASAGALRGAGARPPVVD
jgi:inner membrane transporter RhtA